MGNARSKIHHGFEDDLTKMADGIERMLPVDATLVVLGKPWTQPALLDALSASKGLMVAVRTAAAEVRRARKAVDDDVPRAHALFTALSGALQGYFGKEHPKLAEFGVPLGTRTPPSGAVMVQAAAKAQLTRKLRHTLGRRQRLAFVAKGPISVTLFGADGRVISSSGPVSPGETGATPPSQVSDAAPDGPEPARIDSGPTGSLNTENP